MNHDEQGY